MGKPEYRSYALVPEMAGAFFRCTRCGRDISRGYPFVPVRRDVSRMDAVEGGMEMNDALCVYCDEAPTLPADV